MNPIPKHIAIILDGNRRYASSRGKNPLRGHTDGLRVLLKIAKAANLMGVERLTAYTLSIQNLSRSKKEINHLYTLIEKASRKLRDKRNKERARIIFSGKLSLLPNQLQKEIRIVEEETKNDGPFTLELAVAYGGREELLDVLSRIPAKEKITEKKINSQLWVKGTPELVIRTGGDMRTSNFLPWQSIYSEWFFEKKMWPEFEEKDLRRIIRTYRKRTRRFGR